MAEPSWERQGNVLDWMAEWRQIADAETGPAAEALRRAVAVLERHVAMFERIPEQHMRFGLSQPDGTVEMLPCADWCYACKLERAEHGRAVAVVQLSNAYAAIGRVRHARDYLARLRDAADDDPIDHPARSGNAIYADAYTAAVARLDQALKQAPAHEPSHAPQQAVVAAAPPAAPTESDGVNAEGPRPHTPSQDAETQVSPNADTAGSGGG